MRIVSASTVVSETYVKTSECNLTGKLRHLFSCVERLTIRVTTFKCSPQNVLYAVGIVLGPVRREW